MNYVISKKIDFLFIKFPILFPLSYFLFFECNEIMLNPTKTIPKFNGPSGTTNKPPEKKKEIKTPHHIAYEIATAKYNPFSVGGSESIHDFE